MQRDDVDIPNIMAGFRNEAVRLVDQAKINNLYALTAAKGKFECKLTEEDLNKSFKEALIALQTKEQRRYKTQTDHLT